MSQKSAWEINGQHLRLDLEDADVLERYENAFEALAAEEKEIPKIGRQSERIRAYCDLYRHLYDRIFGEGTAEKIFRGMPTSAEAYDNVYYSFLEFIRAQKTEAAQRRNTQIRKYLPNRQQRRQSGVK